MSEETTTTPQRANERRILFITSFGHLLCHVAELAFIGLIPTVVQDFALPVDRVTLLTVPGFILYGLGGFPAGVFSDRHGPVRALHFYFLAVAVMCLLVFCSATAWQLGMGLTGLGAAISIYHPAGLSMLSLGCSRRGMALGINGVAGNMGVAAGPALGLLVLASGLPWRATYLLVALAALVGAGCLLMTRIEIPAHEPAVKQNTKLTGYANWPLLAILLATMLVGGFNYRSLTTVLPAYLSGHADVASGQPFTTTSLQSGIVFLVFALGGVGQIAGGFLADRFRPALIYLCAILITSPLAFGLAQVSVARGIWVAGLLAVFVFAQQPLENSMLAAATPPRYRSTMYGLKFVFSFGIAALGAYVAGLVWRAAHLQRVFEMYFGLALVMAALAATYGYFSAQTTK